MTDRGYQVLARKWRPQKFDQVVGQDAIVRTLSNALEQGRVAHAYCFSGIRGVGKTTLARLLAKGLNCRKASAPTASPCGTCEACVEIEESRNLDVVEMDAASQTGVDDIRQLNEFARYTPSRDRHRVFIIDEAHMLSTSAFNALLKTLEEPPPHVVFLLATTEPHKIPQTVLSRCQHYPLGRISQAEITARLRDIVAAEGVSVSADGLAMVAISADGSLRDAQSLLDKLIAFGGAEIDDEVVLSLLGMVDRELLFSAADLIGNQDLAGVLGMVNRMVEQGIDLHQFTLDLLGHLRALLIVSSVTDAAEILHLPEADLARLRGQAQLFAIDDLDRGFALLSASEYRIKQSEVPRYQLEWVLSRLARMPRLEPIETLLAELRGEAGGSSGGAAGSGRRPASSGAGGPRSGAAAARDAGGAHAATTAGGNGAAASSVPAGGDRPAASSAPAAGNGPAGAPSARASEYNLILERLRGEKPMIAQLVERAENAELRDDTFYLTFSDTGGIFGARLRDRAAIGAIEAAAGAALGRKVGVVVGFENAATEQPPSLAMQPSDPKGADRQRRNELWTRAEAEPMVRQFVDALRGNLTDVEDI